MPATNADVEAYIAAGHVNTMVKLFRAKSYGRRNARMDEDELKSIAYERLTECRDNFNEAKQCSFKSWASRRIWYAWLDVLKKQVRRGVKVDNRMTSIDQQDSDGQRMPPPVDHKSHEPFEIAIARETLRARPTISIREIRSSCPSALEVAGWARRLQSAMMDAVKPEDVTTIMSQVVTKAKDGNLFAAMLVMNLVNKTVGKVQVKEHTMQTGGISDADIG